MLFNFRDVCFRFHHSTVRFLELIVSFLVSNCILKFIILCKLFINVKLTILFRGSVIENYLVLN